MSTAPQRIAQLRTVSQQLAMSRISSPDELVRWFGALQGQDYAAVKWAIGARIADVTDADIETLIAAKQLVRTWPMRGTLHIVLPEDVQWMTEYVGKRALGRARAMYRSLGLDEAHFAKAADALAAAMPSDQCVTRKEIGDMLAAEGLDVSGQRLYHTIVYLALHAQLVCTALRGKQPTFAWFDYWLPPAQRRSIDREPALQELALRYIQSHGPVAMHDFAWWTGLPMGDVRTAFAGLAERGLVARDASDMWIVPQLLEVDAVPETVHLVPPFDETIVALKDRSAVVSTQDFAKVTPYTNGIFSPVILVDGHFAGLWRKDVKAAGITVSCAVAHRLTASQRVLLDKQVQRYAAFLGLPLRKLDISRL